MSDLTPIFFDANSRMSSLAQHGNLAPVALKSMTDNIWLQAVVNKASELDTSKVINLDGMMTDQIMYL